MNNYKIVVLNSFSTETESDEFITLFNDKLASLFVYYETLINQ